MYLFNLEAYEPQVWGKGFSIISLVISSFLFSFWNFRNFELFVLNLFLSYFPLLRIFVLLSRTCSMLCSNSVEIYILLSYFNSQEISLPF